MAIGVGGQMTLLDLRTLVRRESDTENDLHIADGELTDFVNMSRFELYDMLVTSFGEDYFTARATIPTNGTDDLYPLPNGTLYSAAPAFYKGQVVEAQVGSGLGWVSLRKFNLGEKNRYNLPINQALVSGIIVPRYRLNGSNLMIAPVPTASLNLRLWYAPKLSVLTADADVAEDWSGWLEYVIVDAAIKCVQKQERDATLLVARKNSLKARIEAAAANRDLGEPNTVTETNADGLPYGSGYFGGGGYGGFGY